MAASLPYEVDANGALARRYTVAGTGDTGGKKAVTIHPPTAKNPYHQIVYWLDGQRKVTSGGRTAAEAVSKAAALTKRVKTKATKSDKTVGQMWEAWVSPQRPRAKAWSAKHESTMVWIGQRHIAPTIGSKPCQALTRDDVQRCLNHAPTYGEGKRLRTALKTALKFGYQEGYLTDRAEKLIDGVYWVPPPGMVIPEDEGSEQGADESYVPPEQIPDAESVARLAWSMGNLLTHSSWDELMVFAAAYSGIRLGEMFALSADDVNTSNRTIRVRRQVQSIRGKGQVVDLPKGRKRRTTIYPVRTPPTQRYPDGYPLADEMRRRKTRAAKEGGERLMFPAPGGGFYNPSNFYERRFHLAVMGAEWPTKKVMRRKKNGAMEEVDGLVWTWHDLRHVFCAYYLWDLNAKPVDVSQAAGHENVMTTLRIYSSDAPGALERLAQLG